VGIGAVRVENIDIIEAEAAQALVEGREEIFARAPVAVGAGPHGVAGFFGDDEFVAVRGEIRAEHAAKILFRGVGGRAVVVGEIEVGDAEVEGTQNERATFFVDVDAAEVVPEAEGDRGSFSPLRQQRR